MSRLDDFVAQLFNSLPPGALLPRELDSIFGLLLIPFARELERLEAAAEAMLVDLDPSQTTGFLADFERLLGLPDCGELRPTTPERRANVVEKLTRSGNLRLAFIEAACLTIGYTVTATESAVTDHKFDVDLPSITVTLFRAGESTAGDSLGSFGLEDLQCLIDKIKPAWTTYALTTP